MRTGLHRFRSLRLHAVVLPVVALSFSAPVWAAKPVLPRLQVAPARAPASATVTVRGIGWRQTGSSCGLVRLRAYVDGISPYPAAQVGLVSVKPDGRFARTWRTPRVTDRLEWTIRAEQRCGAASTIRYATVLIG